MSLCAEFACLGPQLSFHLSTSSPWPARPLWLEPKPDEPPLPLKRVVLFSSSVGFFEHRGEIEGNKQIEFAFKTSEINDLLKSLVVQDRDGGLVTAVNYGSPEPVARTLRTFAVDLTATPSLARFFSSFAGIVCSLKRRRALAVSSSASNTDELLQATHPPTKSICSTCAREHRAAKLSHR